MLEPPAVSSLNITADCCGGFWRPVTLTFDLLTEIVTPLTRALGMFIPILIFLRFMFSSYEFVRARRIMRPIGRPHKNIYVIILTDTKTVELQILTYIAYRTSVYYRRVSQIREVNLVYKLTHGPCFGESRLIGPCTRTTL